MIDLDSNPTKLLEVVETGKQMLMTRGALTTFSIANDVGKYFAIIPAAFASTDLVLGSLNIIPLALKGVRYRPLGAAAVLRRHVWIYGIGGIIIPFPGIKLVDMILVALGLV
jgi:K+-transporting ATPase ATPase B chain